MTTRTNDQSIIAATLSVAATLYPYLTEGQKNKIVSKLLAETSDRLRDDEAFRALATDAGCIEAIVKAFVSVEPKLAAKVPTPDQLLAAEGDHRDAAARLTRIREIQAMTDEERLEALPADGVAPSALASPSQSALPTDDQLEAQINAEFAGEPATLRRSRLDRVKMDRAATAHAQSLRQQLERQAANGPMNAADRLTLARMQRGARVR